jgi:predicted PurR-regulated permease PerM
METNARSYFILIVLAAALVLAFLIFKPFLAPLALAAIFAVVLLPVYSRIAKAFRGWKGFSAFLTVLVAAVGIILPVALIGSLIVREAASVYVALANGTGQTYVDTAVNAISAAVPGASTYLESFSANIETYAKGGLQWILGHAGAAFSGIAGIFFSLFIFLISLFYLLKDGPGIRKALTRYSPLGEADYQAITDRLSLAINSIVKGNLSIALLQGTVSGIGFALFGVPNPVLWGAVTAIAALVPGVGTPLVLIPAIGYLFLTGSTGAAIGLIVWGVLAVGLIDNLLGPRLVGKGMQVHPLIVLLSVLGGISFFGPVGLFLGPLTVSFLFAILAVRMEGKTKAE